MKSLSLSLLFAVSSQAGLVAAPSAEVLVDGLIKPVFMTAAEGSEDYFYIAEKDGTVRVFDRKKNALLDKPLLDIRDRIKIKMNEQGLLGIALSPDFQSDGRFYVYYTNLKGDTHVSRFVRNSEDPQSAGSEEVLLTVPQDFRNHNGGWIGFGPDKMLYIVLGDGGAANDPKQRAQDLESYLGKLLRIDVSTEEGYVVPKDNPFVGQENVKPEILSYGLRNPWRCAWQDNELIIADVGQNLWEEVNVVPHKQLFSANFGWPQLEGTHKTNNPHAKTQNPGAVIAPVLEYSHGLGADQGFSLTGGYVYSGAISALKGRYFYADYIQPRIWSAKLEGGKLVDNKNHSHELLYQGKTIKQVSSFAQDPQGELYIISHLGQIFKIVEK